jgi:hypothetical protein
MGFKQATKWGTTMTENQDIAVFPAPQALPLVRPPFNYEVSVEGTMVPQKNSYFMLIGLPGGKAHQVQLDTGSTGIVIPKTMLTDLEGNLPADVVCLGPAEIKYEPSGDVLTAQPSPHFFSTYFNDLEH